MRDNKILDKLFEELIDEAANIAAENLGKSIPEPKKVEFSKEHEEKMKKLFKKERNKSFFRKVSKYLKRVAIFFVILILGLSIVISGVEAWRIRVMNFIIEMNQTNTDIKFVEDDLKGDYYHSDEIIFEYIPEGFKLENSDVQNNRIYLTFRNNEYGFSFTMRSIDASLSIDTENSAVQRFNINGNRALYSTNRNVNILVWHDEEYSYNLTGSIEKKELIKIAENVKK